jgi:hypothetical protein
MKLSNLILIIFAVCVCTGILIIITRLDLIKEQIIAIAALLTSLVSKQNNSVKYGGKPVEIKENIIVDGINITIAIQNFLAFNHGIRPVGNDLYKMTLFTLLKYTSEQIHFVFKTEEDTTLYDFCKNLHSKCARFADSDPLYRFIGMHLNRLKFYNANYKILDTESVEEKKKKFDTVETIRTLERIPKDEIIKDENKDKKNDLHRLKELDDNYIMFLAGIHPDAKIVSRDRFLEMTSEEDHLPSNYNINYISYTDGNLSEETTHINVEETKQSVKYQAMNIIPRLVSPIFEYLDGKVYISDNLADNMTKQKEIINAEVAKIHALYSTNKKNIVQNPTMQDQFVQNPTMQDQFVYGTYLFDENGYAYQDDYGGQIDIYRMPIYNMQGYRTDIEERLVNDWGQLIDMNGNPIIRQPDYAKASTKKIDPKAPSFVPSRSKKFNAKAPPFVPSGTSVSDITEEIRGMQTKK